MITNNKTTNVHPNNLGYDFFLVMGTVKIYSLSNFQI